MKLSTAFQEASIVSRSKFTAKFVTFPLLVCRTRPFSPIFFFPIPLSGRCGERRSMPGYFVAGERNWYSAPRIRLHRVDSIDDTSKIWTACVGICGLGNRAYDHVVSTIDAIGCLFLFFPFFPFFFGEISTNSSAESSRGSRIEFVISSRGMAAPDKWI